jgi:heat-inducible transcriptional repressor
LKSQRNALSDIHKKLNSLVANQALSNVASKIEGLSSGVRGNDRANVVTIMTTLIEMAVEHPEEKVVLAGTSNLARANQDLTESMHPILEALEEQVVLLRLLSDSDSSVKVLIGEEQNEKSLRSTSLVSVGYGDLGAMGIIGPTQWITPHP